MCAVPNMAVFCSSLTSWFPGMLLTYFLNVFEIVIIIIIIIIIIKFLWEELVTMIYPNTDHQNFAKNVTKKSVLF